mmetsp:Transcript_81502/g.244454  ORF Transcript_81502/g.244454 Transcript_81502/m.244454 type:complete len:216 (+) Transcript_81502:1368-2015(+)
MSLQAAIDDRADVLGHAGHPVREAARGVLARVLDVRHLLVARVEADRLPERRQLLRVLLLHPRRLRLMLRQRGRLRLEHLVLLLLRLLLGEDLDLLELGDHVRDGDQLLLEERALVARLLVLLLRLVGRRRGGALEGEQLSRGRLRLDLRLVQAQVGGLEVVGDGLELGRDDVDPLPERVRLAGGALRLLCTLHTQLLCCLCLHHSCALRAFCSS